MSNILFRFIKQVFSNDLLKEDFLDIFKVNSLNGLTITWIQTQAFLDFAEVAKAIATLILLICSVLYTIVKFKSARQHLRWDKEDREEQKSSDNE